MEQIKKKALIAMSGGVDSSLAAKKMIDRGYECIGCTMKLYERPEEAAPGERTCCSLNDVEDARQVAYRLGMKYYVFNFKDDFKEKIIDKFIRCYECGITPNPCIDCNRYMKFEKLYERAVILGCDVIVTGHYAQIEEKGGKYVLKKAADESKDQSYVLYSLTQELLAHTCFPLGGMNKADVRKEAEESGFVNADKPDSQDICFVPDGDYAKVIETYAGTVPEPGNFVDKAGNVIGPNKGIIHYTIGQRKGLGISAPEPLYVCEIRPGTREVVLGSNDDLMSRELTVADFNWISGNAPAEPFRCKAKIRYRQKEQWAEVIPIGEDRVRITFDEPQRAITAGQAAVLYDGDIVLGGGTIQ
ncbi:MAG: tRNA 2-thiouridine(34) synthase MnmA [Lachnospiraceae bacterium]|nr:tRNA 2-thiouridine(34) synthase MnmA [Lachnospiraceae bacterium]